MKIAFCIAAAMAAPLFAFAQHSHSHRSHGAHSHGSGEVTIAFEAEKGVLEFRAPADSVYGFEHEAKTKAQKKAVAEAFQKLESQISQMVAFDASLKCAFTKESIETEREKGNHKHSEVHAEFGIECAKSPAGTELRFDFQGAFKSLKSVDVTVLVDSLQKSLKAEKSGAILSLK